MTPKLEDLVLTKHGGGTQVAHREGKNTATRIRVRRFVTRGLYWAPTTVTLTPAHILGNVSPGDRRVRHALQTPLPSFTDREFKAAGAICKGFDALGRIVRRCPSADQHDGQVFSTPYRTYRDGVLRCWECEFQAKRAAESV